MIADIPSHLDVVLDRDDVKCDLESVIDSMRSLRRETLANGVISSDAEVTYHHLVHRLASSIRALTDDDEEKTLDELVSGVTKKDISLYDLEQETVRKKNEDYFQKLKHTSFNVLGELYNGLEDEYHVLQAVKELRDSNSIKKPFVTSEELINNSKYKQNWFMRYIVGPLTGTKNELIPINDTTIKIITSDDKNRDQLIDKLKSLGIKKLRYAIKLLESEKELEDLKKFKEIPKNALLIQRDYYSANSRRKNRGILFSLPSFIQSAVGKKSEESYKSFVFELNNIKINKEQINSSKNFFLQSERETTNLPLTSQRFHLDNDIYKGDYFLRLELPMKDTIRYDITLYCYSDSPYDSLFDYLLTNAVQFREELPKNVLNMIDEKFHPEYVHLRRYEAGEKTADLELIK